MEDCACFRDRKDETVLRVGQLSDILSIYLITAILQEGLCPAMAERVAGQVAAAMSARIYLMSIGEEEAKKIEGVPLLALPSTRAILERVIALARTTTEETHIART